MRILLISVFYALTAACVYKNYKYKDGDTWVVRSTFVMKCTILKSGSWSAKVIGCRTSGGVFVEPGHSIIEGDTKYDCLDMGHDHVEIRRTYYNGGKQESCEGHVIGHPGSDGAMPLKRESWVSQYNFRKTCTENGARITECLTDAGFAVPLNRHLVFSGIIYKLVVYNLVFYCCEPYKRSTRY
uniref:Abnormal cell migration protein 18-like fibronectin type I domain-containing protein n=1 Tax=Angiostrongylus cantonensis TaxID=6313 RepID=A0A0K0DD47_ANGCA